MAIKLNNFVAFADTSREPTQDEKFKTFYDVKPEKISYLEYPEARRCKTIPRIAKHGKPIIVYKQNMMTFFLDPYALKVKNPHQELYQNVSHKTGGL